MPASKAKRASSTSRAKSATRQQSSDQAMQSLVFPIIIFTALSLIFAFIAFYKYAW